jgi:hypothetical protein
MYKALGFIFNTVKKRPGEARDSMEQTQQVLSTYLYIGKAEKGGC